MKNDPAAAASRPAGGPRSPSACLVFMHPRRGRGMASGDPYAELTAEGKARFGPAHVLKTVNSPAYPFLVKTTVEGGAPTTVINLCEAPVARAILKYGRGIVGQEYALMRDKMDLLWAPITSMDPRSRGWVFPEGKAEQSVTSHVTSHAYYTSAMTRNAHAADFARYEYAKYTHLQGGTGKGLLRAIPLLTRAYVAAAASLYSVSDIDLGTLTGGMRLDDADQEIIDLETNLLLKVRRLRLRRRRIDIRPDMAAIDEALGRQPKTFADE